MSEKRPDVYNPTLRHYIAVLPLFLLTKLLQSTVRLEAAAEDVAKMSSPERLVGVAWHSRIFFLAMCKYWYRDNIPMSGLVSASRDGAYLCAFFRLSKIGAVRGSHKRRGAAAVKELVDTVRGGGDVFITPDGPVGPKNRAKAGFALVAKESGVRVLVLKITPKSYWRIAKTWDKFILPKPFSKAHIEVLEFKTYDELERAAAAQNIAPEKLVENFLNSDNID